MAARRSAEGASTAAVVIPQALAYAGVAGLPIPTGTEVWLAALTQRVLDLAKRSPRWNSLEGAGRVHPTVASAVDVFVGDA